VSGRPRPGRPRRFEAGERGSALVEFCWVALILFIPITWVVISVFAVQQGAFAVNGAARAAARAYALAPDDATGAARAQAVVDQTLADQGGEGQVARVEVTCEPYPSDCHAGTSMITVHVHSAVTVPLLPEVLANNRRSFKLTARHTVPIGQFVAVPNGDDE
jgi:Flp pilus assembly protein TadG